jgi:simple sugar transport system permease protein
MSFLYLAGDSAQMTLGLSSAVAGLFQGTMLFLLLAVDVFIHYRLRATPAPVIAPSTATAIAPVAAEAAS